jgi:Flp pilus assembly protein TadB
MGQLFKTPEGHKLLIAALVLQALGVALIVKIVKIKV